MPKATSQTFRAQPTSAAQRPKKGGESSAAAAAGGARNHLFDTAKFGQHILTNPLVAQG